MPLIVWGAIGLAGLVAGGWAAGQAGDAAEQAGEAADKTANLVRWVVIGGTVYAGYRAAKAGGLLK